MNALPTTRSSIVTAIKTFTTQKSLLDGKSIHAHVIKLRVLPETQLHNHLLNMYSKCFDFDSARKLLDEMSEPNLVSYSALISGYSQSDTPECALGCLIDLRRKGLILNQYVFSSLILVFSKMGCVKQGKQIHAQVIVSDFESDKFVRTNLAEMYSKSGDLESAVSVFRLSAVRDSIMFNSMISGLVSYGMYGEAVEMFNEARSDVCLKISEFTFGSVINININTEQNDPTATISDSEEEEDKESSEMEFTRTAADDLITESNILRTRHTNATNLGPQNTNAAVK